MSPHAAAELDGVNIQLDDLQLPSVEGNLIIEGAGGVMVPLNGQGLLFIDLFVAWNLPIIVVSRHYLGSINHTLMTIEVLKKRGCKIKGIVFVGDKNDSTETAIIDNSGVTILGRVPLTEIVNKNFVLDQAQYF